MNQFEVYEKWYNMKSVQFELIKNLKNRELALLSKHEPNKSTRMLKCHNTRHFDFIINSMLNISRNKTLFSFYRSLGLYENGIPNQSSTLKNRDNSFWKDHHHEQMIGFDFPLDIDAGDLSELPFAHESANKILTFFNYLNVPYYLKFSGKGFHFTIPFSYFPKEYSFNPYDEEKETIYRLMFKIGKYIHENYSEMVDFGIYDSRRIFKLPYSLAVYPSDENCYVCFPFKKIENFINFNINEYIVNEKNIDSWDKRIKCRGSFLFNSSGNLKELLYRVGVE